MTGDTTAVGTCLGGEGHRKGLTPLEGRDFCEGDISKHALGEGTFTNLLYLHGAVVPSQSHQLPALGPQQQAHLLQTPC